MRYRKLRIAWSVVWGVVVVLLIVLWVRSYRCVETWNIPVTRSTHVYLSSIPNAFAFGLGNSSPTATREYRSMPATKWLESCPYSGAAFFQITAASVAMPYWFGVLLSTTFAAAPLMRTARFSLRTLLIATTLVAVGLGAIIWITK